MTPHEKRAQERFASDTTEHALEILRDDGLYRHLRARQPGTSMYWFDVITWPGNLCVRGDMGSFVFSRLEDMFEFFGSKTERVNPQYWSEKVVAGQPTRAYSVDVAVQLLREQVSAESLEWHNYTPQEQRTIRDAVEDMVRGEDMAYAEGAHRLVEEFEVPFLGGKPFRFCDTWEYDFEEYTIHFLWCCHALVWAIGQYDAAHDAVRA